MSVRTAPLATLGRQASNAHINLYIHNQTDDPEGSRNWLLFLMAGCHIGVIHATPL